MKKKMYGRIIKLLKEGKLNWSKAAFKKLLDEQKEPKEYTIQTSDMPKTPDTTKIYDERY